MAGKTYVVGDIHGGYRGFKQVMERSGINPNRDRLICLGDVCDGWPQVPDVFEELFRFRNLVYILGNHDIWARDWLLKGFDPMKNPTWYFQGGAATVFAYDAQPELKEKHGEFLKEKSLPYHVDDQKRCFVHGGFDADLPIDKQEDKNIYYWDRGLQEAAWNHKDEDVKFGGFEEIFLGHTQTLIRDSDHPLHHANVWCLDTGARGKGPITLMDVETKEYWQSDAVEELYHG